ncbi:unnamed protein product [Hermetia illucens]|uniref:Vesicle transport protein USE1 n=1 Tax=Hermetia illucens TaxID=343691 RepID=A0A7R8YS86_HERIL|nr:vesicle transport protein USE1 [Hermetia illucens]CAD7083556.1 unnamed protein product [Hermetia illucens]
MVSKLEINIRSLLSNCEESVNDTTNHWRLKKHVKSLETMIAELEELSEDSAYKVLSDYKSRLASIKASINYVESPPAPKKLRENRIQNETVESNLRKELLEGSSLRKRPVAEENMGQAMKYYSDYQERITEDMLALTRNLREQTETANKIIKRDTEIVSKSTMISDSNLGSLSKEAEKLQDHSRRAWKCWMWLMLGLVMAIFLFMVLFMKIMKKKST